MCKTWKLLKRIGELEMKWKLRVTWEFNGDCAQTRYHKRSNSGVPITAQLPIPISHVF